MALNTYTYTMALNTLNANSVGNVQFKHPHPRHPETPFPPSLVVAGVVVMEGVRVAGSSNTSRR